MQETAKRPFSRNQKAQDRQGYMCPDAWPVTPDAPRTSGASGQPIFARRTCKVFMTANRARQLPRSGLESTLLHERIQHELPPVSHCRVIRRVVAQTILQFRYKCLQEPVRGHGLRCCCRSRGISVPGRGRVSHTHTIPWSRLLRSCDATCPLPSFSPLRVP